MRKFVFLGLLFFTISSCYFNAENHKIRGNWILSVTNDSTYSEVNIYSKNNLAIYYKNDCSIGDRRNYKITKDNLFISSPNKPKKYSKYVIKSFSNDKIILENTTLIQTIILNKIEDSEFTANLCKSFKDVYYYEIASKNRKFRFSNIDSILVPDYENYLKIIKTLNVDDELEEEIPISEIKE